ncbi:flagellar biosynthesis/type III secretory pathway protein FliH [Pseudomonas frederiksbergensis]|uniref:hypothetical protein n=1 Tax=Pseudomonas frederiksbergensis TaxID=104087 RepID=UPI003D25E2AF
MNALIIPCIFLPGSMPHATLIPATELAEYFSATSVLAQAHAEAELIQQQARECLAQAEEQAQLILDQARDQSLAEAAHELNTLRQELIEETLDWHVAETTLEITLAQHLDTRLRALVALVLEEFIGEQDGAELMVRRVQQRLLTFLTEGALTVRVSPASENQAQRAFAAYPQVQVISTPSLTMTEALLETHLFTLRIDLDAHLQSLLSRLKQTPREPAIDDYQD